MATYNKFNNFVEMLVEKQIDVNVDEWDVYLSNAVPDAEADLIKTDLAEIGFGNGYTAPVDTQQTMARATTTVTVTGTKVVILAAGGAIAQFQYIVLWDATSDDLIAWWDYGSALDLADGESLTIKFNNGDPTGTIFTLI